MRLEALHRVIKYCYLNGKQNKRIDKLISILLKLVRDKIFDRLIKLTNSETAFERETKTRHCTGAEIDGSAIQAAAKDQWLVKSQSADLFYTVTCDDNKSCDETCQLVCKDCRTCIHCWTCTCKDNVLRRHMCKHIHAVSLIKLRVVDKVEPSTQQQCEQVSIDQAEKDNLMAAATSIQAVRPKETPTSARCALLLDAIRTHLQHPLPDTFLSWLEPTLQEALSRISAITNTQSAPTVSSKRKIEPQRRFFSKKRSPLPKGRQGWQNQP